MAIYSNIITSPTRIIWCPRHKRFLMWESVGNIIFVPAKEHCSFYGGVCSPRECNAIIGTFTPDGHEAGKE